MTERSDSGAGRDPLSIDRIHHWVRMAEVVRRHPTESSRTSRLAMLALCVACLFAGSTARELTHWALGDKVSGPYATHLARVGPHFRCGDGTLLPPPDPVGTDRTGYAATDDAPALPQPNR